MASENNFLQPVVPRFGRYYDHWSMVMENFLLSKEYWTLIETGIEEPEKGKPLSEAQQKDLEQNV